MTADKLRTLRIMTYNIHKGFSFGDRRFTLEQIRQSARDSKADIVCLQEAMGLHKNEPIEEPLEFLADQIWSHYAYGRNAVYDHGHHGNAILSKYPFASSSNIDVSSHEFENRGILHGVLTCPEWGADRLHVMTLHLALFAWGRRRQLARLCEMIEDHIPLDEPLIVCGDFNDWRETASDFLGKRVGLREIHLSANGQHARTFPSFFPLLCLDRIYIRGDLEVVSTKCLNPHAWYELSDHLALTAELRWG